MPYIHLSKLVILMNLITNYSLTLFPLIKFNTNTLFTVEQGVVHYQVILSFINDFYSSKMGKKMQKWKFKWEPLVQAEREYFLKNLDA